MLKVLNGTTGITLLELDVVILILASANARYLYNLIFDEYFNIMCNINKEGISRLRQQSQKLTVKFDEKNGKHHIHCQGTDSR